MNIIKFIQSKLKPAPTEVEIQNKQVDKAINTFTEINKLYYKLAGNLLALTTSFDDVIKVWENMSKGFSMKEILLLIDKFKINDVNNYEGLLIGCCNGQFASMSNGIYHFNLKTLVDIFFSLLSDSDELNDFSDYLEAKGIIDEDGFVQYKFEIDGEKTVLMDYSDYYKSVDYNEVTGEKINTDETEEVRTFGQRDRQ